MSLVVPPGKHSFLIKILLDNFISLIPLHSQLLSILDLVYCLSFWKDYGFDSHSNLYLLVHVTWGFGCLMCDL